MLDARQQAIVIGTLLGDGCLEKNGTHARLKVDHGATQKEYVEWKFHELKSVATGSPKQIGFFDRRTSKTYIHWRFATQSRSEFDCFWSAFYKSGRKIIPGSIMELLNAPLALAVWYMDDGYLRKDCKALHLSTQGYTENEQVLLQKCLLENFGIETNIHQVRKYFKLYIPFKQAGKFCRLVESDMIPSMSHKLL